MVQECGLGNGRFTAGWPMKHDDAAISANSSEPVSYTEVDTTGTVEERFACRRSEEAVSKLISSARR